MKTKIFTLIFVLISLCAFTQTTEVLELTGVSSGSEFYYCNTVDTVIVYKPNSAGVCMWYPNGNPPGQQEDSLVVTQNSPSFWRFYDGSNTILFYIYFISISPEECWTVTDTSKCPESTIVLNAQSGNHQPDFTYEWSFGGVAMTQTSQQITVSDEGIYSVTVTGACGSMDDYIEVINHDSPTPDLGPDMTNVCDWDAPTLDPGSFQEYDWSTGDNSSTIVAYGTDTYAVTVTDDNGCTASDEIDISFYVNPGIEISVVTVDTTNGNNKIMWDTDIPDFQSHLVTIWRNGATNDINNEVGVVQYTDGEFTDTVNSESRTWRYAITANDDCGNWSSPSPYHESMKISIVSMTNNAIQIEWTHYGVESKSVNSYYLYSVQGFGTSWIATPITTLPGSQDSYDYMPLVSDSLYIVGAEIGGTKSTNEMAISMIDNPQIITGVQDGQKNEFSLYPNPAKDHFMIIGEGYVEVYDMLGKQIKNFPVYGNQKVALKSGVYFVIFTDKNTKQTFTKKVIIQ